MNQLPGHAPEKPSEYADALYYLITAAPSLLKQITESIMVVNSKVDLLANEIHKGGKP